MANPPYDIIFADNNHAEHTLSLLEHVGVIQHVLDSFDFLKLNVYHTYSHILTF